MVLKTTSVPSSAGRSLPPEVSSSNALTTSPRPSGDRNTDPAPADILCRRRPAISFRFRSVSTRTVGATACSLSSFSIILEVIRAQRIAWSNSGSYRTSSIDDNAPGHAWPQKILSAAGRGLAPGNRGRLRGPEPTPLPVKPPWGAASKRGFRGGGFTVGSRRWHSVPPWPDCLKRDRISNRKRE